jgi:epoxyqueuosine reductase QueG
MAKLDDHEIAHFAQRLGAEFFGVADISPVRDFVLSFGGLAMAEYPRAVSLGVSLSDTIVNALSRWAERAVARRYSHHVYDVTNVRLDLMASRLAAALQRDGYKSLVIPASERVDDQRICAAFSHKLAAGQAGLGWIGKSCLLITPERGPRVRWVTVLTDAPLRPTGRPIEQDCGTCNECVDVCPVHALSGRAFCANEAREARLDARKCDEYRDHMKAITGFSVCGLCLYVCPYGR